MSAEGYLLSLSLYLVVSVTILRVVVRRAYRRHGRLGPAPQVLQGAVFIGWGALTWADLPAGFPSNPVAPWLRLVGWILLAAGLTTMVGLIVWFDLGRAAGWRVGGLERRGPYAFSRNPQLVACLVGAAGYGLLWQSLHALGWLAALAAVAHVMVLTEEEHLGRVFGREYEAYCRQVPRYLGPRRRRRPAAGGWGGAEPPADDRR